MQGNNMSQEKNVIYWDRDPNAYRSATLLIMLIPNIRITQARDITDIQELINTNPNPYNTLVIESSTCFRENTYQDYLEYFRKENKLSIILYTGQEESIINNKLKLIQGRDYDYYVDKKSKSQMITLEKAINNLV